MMMVVWLLAFYSAGSSALVMSPVGTVARAGGGPFAPPPTRVGPFSAKTDENSEERKPKITMQGLMELVTLGLGAPNLGTFKGVDKETGALKFELESNRFIAKDGKEYNSFDNSKGTYFEYGEVDESEDVMKKLGNLFGIGSKDDNDGASNKR